MKNIKMLLIILVAAAVATLGLIKLLDSKAYYDISAVNKNLNAGEFKLLYNEEKLGNELEKKYTLLPGFGGKNFISENEGIEFQFSGFPDVLDKWVITKIKITNPEYSVFGFSAGDSIDKAEQILEKNGFKKSATSSDSYKKGKIYVYFSVNSDGIIESISVGLESTNKKNVVF